MQIFIQVFKKAFVRHEANGVSGAMEGPSSQAGLQHYRAIHQRPSSPSTTRHMFSMPLWGRICEALMTACSFAAQGQAKHFLLPKASVLPWV